MRSPLSLGITALAAALLLAPFTPQIPASEATLKNSVATAEWAALMKEHGASKLGYPQRAAAFAPRFRAFAEKHHGTPEALEAMFKLFANCWWKRSESPEAMYAAGKAMADEIFKKYPNHDGLAGFTTRHYVLDKAGKEDVFGRLRKTKKPLLQASGVLGLARIKKGDESTALYRLLVDKYADVPYRHTTHGKIAQASLFRHDPADLVVGKEAPDIEGEDIEGVSFKLSDYRGKVVLLDFWGHW